MEMEQLKKALRAQIEEYKTLAFELSDQMAREPEIGSQEYKSSAAIVKLLRDHGVEVEYPFAGYRTAFRGQICPERKVRMALLAEYDALRGLGHACGHCASGSGSVLAALAFQAFRDEYLFGVDIIGTPDEEYIGTKIGMAEKGIFDGYDFVAMVHMGPQTTAEVQFIALDGIGARWHGKPAHAAGEPWSGRNALNAARLFFDATDAMRQHIIPEARIHGIIKNGGACLITADHGNCEQMLDEKGEPFTPHTTNPVPLIWVSDDAKGKKLRDGGRLCDLAPTLLDIMHLPVPKEMTGHSLIER